MSRLSDTASANAETHVQMVRDHYHVKSMLETPFFHRLRDERLTDRELSVFFCQYYSIVKTSYRMLAAGILATPTSETDIIQHLAEFLYTEAGDRVSHGEYYHRWAAGFDVTVPQLLGAEFNQGARDFERTLMSYFESGDGFQMLAAQLGVEDCAEVLIWGLHDGFRKYDMSSRCFAYLAAHLLIENDEDGHSRWAIDSLCQHPQLESRAEELGAIYGRVYAAFQGVFDNIHADWVNPAGSAKG